jgi:hypothetical protein
MEPIVGKPVRSGSDYESIMAKRLDRLLVLAAAALLIVVFWNAFAGRVGHHASVKPLPPAPVPELVRLVPSTTAFLPRCPAADLHLALGPGPTLTLRFAGGRCHVPPLRLQAVTRDASGAVAYRGPALAHEDLSGNYAVSGVAHARLQAPCGRVTVSGSGLTATGTIRCP